MAVRTFSDSREPHQAGGAYLAGGAIVAAEAADDIREFDIVERALAILEEESRSWARRPGPHSAAETGPAGDEPPGDSG